MSAALRFAKLFDGYQEPAKDQDDYAKKQAEEPLPFRPRPAPKRGPVTSPIGPLEVMTAAEIVHATRCGS